MDNPQSTKPIVAGLKAIHAELVVQTTIIKQQQILIGKLQSKLNQLYILLALVLVIIPILCGIAYFLMAISYESSYYP